MSPSETCDCLRYMLIWQAFWNLSFVLSPIDTSPKKHWKCKGPYNQARMYIEFMLTILSCYRIIECTWSQWKKKSKKGIINRHKSVCEEFVSQCIMSFPLIETSATAFTFNSQAQTARNRGGMSLKRPFVRCALLDFNITIYATSIDVHTKQTVFIWIKKILHTNRVAF